jgi:diguanylate cyclase (GGDEF)-like protein
MPRLCSMLTADGAAARYARILLLSLLLPVTLAKADRDPMADLRFVPAGGTSALIDGIVSSLAQDSRGLLWMGTAAGLMRYDGYQTKPFPMTSADGERGNRFLRTLVADGPLLWAGGDAEGLARFDTHTERWTLYRHDRQRPESIAPGSVFKIARGPDGRIWLGMLAGLECLDPATGGFEHHRVADGRGLPDDRVSALLFDRRGDFWVGTWRGLVRRRAGSERFEPVGGGLLQAAAVDGVIEGPDGRIWVGTRDGRVMTIDPADGATRLLDGGEPGMSSSQLITLLNVSGREVWVGRTAGIEVRDRDGRLLKTLRPDRRKTGSLVGTVFHALLQDRAGTVWVGNYGGGLQRHHPESNGLWVRKEDADPASPLADPDVRSALQLDNGDIWLGTAGRGIAILDGRLASVGVIGPDDRFGGLVSALAQTPDGSVWAGNNRSQLFRFDRERRLRDIWNAGQAGVRRLFGGRDNTLWVGTIEGLHRLAPGARELERVALADGGRRMGNVNAIIETAEGRLWVGGDNGLFRVEDGQLKPHDAGPGLPKAAVLGLLLDARGTLWVDTNLGLFRHVAGKGFEDVSTPAGFGDRSFGANLLDDAEGRIWTHRGVYEPALRRFTEFGKVDGADIGTGWFRSYAKLHDGRMLFGGSTGLLVVEPQRFRRWAYQPPMVATELRIDSRELPAGQLASGLALAPPQRSFSVGFASLDLSVPLQNRYRYRLEGYDEDWITASAEQRVASYANLPPGRYTLRLQGSNRLGEWSEPPLRIDVDVRPAWWQTWWARGVGALLALLSVYGLVLLRTRQLQRRQVWLEQNVQQRTAELQALSEALRQKSTELELSSLSDPLTGLHNRRYLTQHIEADVALALRRPADPASTDPRDLVFLLVDVDHFKHVNDQYGHSAGDAVLVQMSERLRRVCRDSDHVVRWGGEEFLIVARNGSRQHAAAHAERIRRSVADQPFLLPDGQLLARTCSIGFACFPLAPAHPQALAWNAVVDVADGALYEAKHSGRNAWVGVLGAAPTLGVDGLAALLDQTPSQWLASGQLEVVRSGAQPSGNGGRLEQAP